MPVFDTPEPIAVTVEFGVGSLKITATDRADTVVEVRPSDEADQSDVEAAQQLRVDLSHGELRITGPKRMFDFSKKTRSVDVTVELPTGSSLSAHLQMGSIRATGRLGECRLKTTGDVSLDHTGPLRLHTGVGAVTAGTVAGDADVSTGSGTIQLGRVEGAVVAKNSNGETAIDTATGDVRVRNANGRIDIGRAAAGVDAKTSSGDIRLGEAVRGSVVLGTALGGLDIGIAPGTAAWLEVSTSYGHVRNQMEHVVGPDEAAQTVEVRGRTSYGDIVIHHS
ncbi:hypothetical protein Aab01nite_65220 [Paractinoplanes abujensis]|uniref:DUF4097 and DUF4098 domain-containing protein YvlB n=1 Tax=Paractinoplanes abujensis TaxID=882441 RepID=A0A7W7CQH3_9ACTN|nr:DUF4097 family beta strand repeat-containing protein [Actinoplanes abujensis]MBB4692569.1 DUF4097 and DUF4098 domain-containing protein YvlB [Actinoplanes abujensis]GID22932.1 hypothetical protein Aab01nite_65220 [Actinoplanes abujensis]